MDATPVRCTSGLVFAGEIPIGEAQGAPRPISLPTFDAWTDQSRELFEPLEAFDATNVTLTGLGSATRMGANHVTPGFFRMLDVFPLLGRIPRDIGRTSTVAVISHRLWQGKLGTDPGVLGRTLVIGAEPHIVIGVLSDGCLSKRT